MNFNFFLKGEYDDALMNTQHPERIQVKSVLRQQNTLETAEKQKNKPKPIQTQAFDEPPPNAPNGRDDISYQIVQMCETNYAEPMRLIYWRMKSDGEQFSILWRERRRGWYFQELVTKENEQWSSECRVLPSFLPLLEPDDTVWVELTKKATTEDWCALDDIFLNTLAFPGSEIILAGSDLVALRKG